MIAPLWLVSSTNGRRAVVVPVTYCAACGQDMPTDHPTHINGEAAPVAPGAAPDPQKEIQP